MKTGEPLNRPIDLHGLNLCEETLRRFLNYSALLDIEDLHLSKRLELINRYEQLAALLVKIRVGYNLFKASLPEKTHYKKTEWGSVT